MMKGSLLRLLLGACLCCYSPIRGIAQLIVPRDSTTLVTILTTDGNEFFGKVIADNTDFLVLQTDGYAAVSIRKSIIKSLQPVSPLRLANGKYWFDNKHASHYFAGPSAYGLRKGEGYYDNGLVIFSQFSYGLSDRFSISAGVAPLIIFDEAMPVWVAPKISIPLRSDKVHLAIGSIFGQVFNAYNDYGDGTQNFGAVYGICTIGSPDVNVSGGFGFAYENNNWSRKPVFSLAGTYRAARWFSWITENYFLRSDYEKTTLLSFGGRFLLRRVAFDTGLGLPIVSDDGVYPFPWLGMHVLFGNPKN